MYTESYGSPSPLGLSCQGDSRNFAVYSAHAKEVWLGLFAPQETIPHAVIPLTRTDNIWHIALKNLPPETLYGYQCHGDWSEPFGDLFTKDHWLLDPYAKVLDSSTAWNKAPMQRILAPITPPAHFHWDNIAKPNLPKQNLIIYEMHLRGFTAHSSSQTTAPGTYAAMIEKIPYLKQLGITAVELMPIFEFDECHLGLNYWGYNPLSFFAPKRSYTSDSALGSAVTEFKKLVQALHREGLEVILDVVYNHTGEEKDKKHAISWRGIDNRTYYFLSPTGEYRDYAGCGNAISANHPAVQELILASLRYWATEMQIDGFRFDLASILTRGPDGKPMKTPPLLEAIKNDPILSQCKLIAEPWDATGLYQVGAFPHWGPWSEWNGHYRDIARTFLKGTDGEASNFANILFGSDQFYTDPLSSVNFITSHDGFSLRDLVTYQQKNNWANNESNRDGTNQNDNWNCGVEGPTDNPEIQALRERQMRNHFLALFISQGIPMLLMGDEYGHTRHGNNNPYTQDNETNWFLWDICKQNQSIFHFVQGLIAFRKMHPELCHSQDQKIEWHHTNWNERFIAFTLGNLFIAFNANFQPVEFDLPNTPWNLVVDTQNNWDKQWFQTTGPELPSHIQMQPYSALIATKK